MHLFLCNKSSRRQIQCLDQMDFWNTQKEYEKMTFQINAFGGETALP